MLALALVLDGASRADAARACGMDRQTLRDWVHRYNDEGLAGLSDRRGAVCPRPRLSPEQAAVVAELVRAGPDPAMHGLVRSRRQNLRRGHTALRSLCDPFDGVTTYDSAERRLPSPRLRGWLYHAG